MVDDSASCLSMSQSLAILLVLSIKNGADDLAMLGFRGGLRYLLRSFG